jgi:hypothetical protein
MKRHLGAFGLLSAVAVATVVSRADAIGTTVITLPVTACAISSSTGTANYDWTGIQNTSSSGSLSLQCATTIDDGVGDGYDTERISVYVVDQSTSSRVSCSIRVVDQMGELILFLPAQSGSAPVGVDEPMIFTMDTTAGSPRILCTIPPTVNGRAAEVTGILTLH